MLRVPGQELHALELIQPVLRRARHLVIRDGRILYAGPVVGAPEVPPEGRPTLLGSGHGIRGLRPRTARKRATTGRPLPSKRQAGALAVRDARCGARTAVVARVRAVLRRTQGEVQSTGLIRIGALERRLRSSGCRFAARHCDEA